MPPFEGVYTMFSLYSVSWHHTDSRVLDHIWVTLPFSFHVLKYRARKSFRNTIGKPQSEFLRNLLLSLMRSCLSQLQGKWVWIRAFAAYAKTILQQLWVRCLVSKKRMDLRNTNSSFSISMHFEVTEPIIENS